MGNTHQILPTTTFLNQLPRSFQNWAPAAWVGYLLTTWQGLQWLTCCKVVRVEVRVQKASGRDPRAGLPRWEAWHTLLQAVLISMSVYEWGLQGEVKATCLLHFNHHLRIFLGSLTFKGPVSPPGSSSKSSLCLSGASYFSVWSLGFRKWRHKIAKSSHGYSSLRKCLIYSKFCVIKRYIFMC